jgi:hypothetical protein
VSGVLIGIIVVVVQGTVVSGTDEEADEADVYRSLSVS